MTREEHLNWCKQRANEYLSRGDLKNGITSMMSDLNKHPETKGLNDSMAMVGLLYAMNDDMEGAKRFVEGFR